jgi:hypothetical protein
VSSSLHGRSGSSGKAGSEPIPSGLPQKADIVDAFWHFQFVPEADMGHGN